MQAQSGCHIWFSYLGILSLIYLIKYMYIYVNMALSVQLAFVYISDFRKGIVITYSVF